MGNARSENNTIKNGDNALHVAAKAGNVAEVESQVRKFDINATGEYGGTALCWASRQGKTEVVKLLITLNADVNIPDVSTPTMISNHPLSISLIPHIAAVPFFLHISSCIVITLSRCTTFDNSTIFMFLLLVVIVPYSSTRVSRLPRILSPHHSHTYTHIPLL